MTYERLSGRALAAASIAVLSLAGAAQADTVLVALDRKVKLVDGVVTVVQSPKPDAVAVVDLSANPPKVTATIENVPVRPAARRLPRTAASPLSPPT
jgi:hypothetical protein